MDDDWAQTRCTRCALYRRVEGEELCRHCWLLDNEPGYRQVVDVLADIYRERPLQRRRPPHPAIGRLRQQLQDLENRRDELAAQEASDGVNESDGASGPSNTPLVNGDSAPEAANEAGDEAVESEGSDAARRDSGSPEDPGLSQEEHDRRVQNILHELQNGGRRPVDSGPLSERYAARVFFLNSMDGLPRWVALDRAQEEFSQEEGVDQAELQEAINAEDARFRSSPREVERDRRERQHDFGL